MFVSTYVQMYLVDIMIRIDFQCNPLDKNSVHHADHIFLHFDMNIDVNNLDHID